MHHKIHRITIKGVIYEYNAIMSATRKDGIYKSFMRVYGLNRTKEEAMALVRQWELKNQRKYKHRCN